MAFPMAHLMSSSPSCAPRNAKSYLDVSPLNIAFRPSCIFQESFKRMPQNFIGITRKSIPVKIKFKSIPGLAFASSESAGNSNRDSNPGDSLLSIENLKKYKWMLAPLALIPAATLPGVPWKVLKENYWMGFFRILIRDLFFVFAVDLFLSLADRFGEHNKNSKFLQWIPPWESSPWPKAYKVTKHGLIISQLIISTVVLFLGPPSKMFPLVGLTFIPYLILIGIQEVYERILSKDKIITSPLAPIIFSFYRLNQLMRNFFIFEHSGGIPYIGRLPPSILVFNQILLYLSISSLVLYLSLMPWIYSSWTPQKDKLPPFEMEDLN